MAVVFCGHRSGQLLMPVSASDARELVLLPERVAFTVTAEAKAPLRLSRWYRAGVQLLVEATGRWPTTEVAHREISIRAGFFESFVLSTDGDVRYTAVSTAGWGLVEWRTFLDAALPVMLEYAGETHAQFRNRVDRFFGITLKEAWES